MAATTGAGPAPGPERLRQTTLAQRLLARPAAGALVIVVFVFIVFSVLSALKGSTAFLSIPGVLNYVGVASQVGIIATAVALLMVVAASGTSPACKPSYLQNQMIPRHR